MSKEEKVIIVGSSGSGKDFLLRKLVEKNLKPCVKMTTRPPRINEVQNISYNFVDFETFKTNIDHGQFICYQKFEVTPQNKSPEIWYYGITKEEFEKSQIFIMTPGDLSQIKKSEREKCFVVYLDISRSVREERLSNRKDKNDSIQRRLDADELDFKYFRDYDLKITDPEFTADEIYDLMY